MNLLDTLDPHLTSDDTVVRQFALEAVSNYPSVKPEWTMRLMHGMMADRKVIQEMPWKISFNNQSRQTAHMV